MKSDILINAGTSGTSSTISGNISTSYSIRTARPSQTSGGTEKPKFLPLGGDTEFMQNALSVISKVENPKVAKAGENVLIKIQNIMSHLKGTMSDNPNIPKLQGAITDDGAFLIEWATEKFRAGISVEPNESDSGWYIVTSKDLGDNISSGSLLQKDEDEIINYLLHYVVSNT